MLWKALALLALAGHAAWVLFNVLAPLWAWRRPAVRVAHLATLALTVGAAILLGACPITSLENLAWLRSEPARASPGGFIARWAAWVVYWDVPAAGLLAATAAWLALWSGIYARLWRRERGSRSAPDPQPARTAARAWDPEQTPGRPGGEAAA